MSYYVYGSKMSYGDYLTGKSFVADMTSATNSAGKSVTMALSRQTREVIASNEALARNHIQAMEVSADRIAGSIDEGFQNLTGTMNAGFEQLSYGMEEISSGIAELNATFHWGFGEVIAVLGHMNDALSELMKIAKTPVQTVAFNHFEIARDAYRQSLYRECLEELDKAIAGDHTSAGYKLEWRFHQMKGTLQLGFAGGDLTLIDLASAEQSFLLAARYARTDYPEDAARAFLSAGWAAYCQGKIAEALAHTEQATALHPRLGEAFFQTAKVRMAMGEVDKALLALEKAIDLDRFYALKAAGDGDFQQHDKQLQRFLDAMKKEKYRQSIPIVKTVLEKINFWLENDPQAINNQALIRMDAFLKNGVDWPLIDMIEEVQSIEKIIAEIESSAQNSRIVISVKVPMEFKNVEESYMEEENYQEEILIKPGGLFHRAIKETVTKTRLVYKTRIIKKANESIRDDIYTGFGKKLTSIEYVHIPMGKFIMGDQDKSRQVTLTKDFYLGKYPVTQAQWEAVMDENPSHFKGCDHPVEQVSWEDVQIFIYRLNGLAGGKAYRLPTEAEWEYSCRAGSKGDYCFGDDENELEEYAWFNTNSGKQTHSVGLKKANAWGIHDMHGNVWEWCQDWYGDYPSGNVTDPTGPTTGSGRVLRGGCWEGSAGACLSVARLTLNPGSRSGGGFRLVLT